MGGKKVLISIAKMRQEILQDKDNKNLNTRRSRDSKGKIAHVMTHVFNKRISYFHSPKSTTALFLSLYLLPNIYINRKTKTNKISIPKTQMRERKRKFLHLLKKPPQGSLHWNHCINMSGG